MTTLHFTSIYLSYLYIYPPDWQESDEGTNTLSKQLPGPAFGDPKFFLSA